MASSALLILLYIATLAFSAPKARVILIIGQSNSVGFNTDGRTEEDVSHANILQTSCCVNYKTDNENCQLMSGQDPLHHQCDYGYLTSQNVGFGMSIARQIRKEALEEDIVVIVPAGIAGAGFADKIWPAYTGRGFWQAVKRLNNTFAILHKEYSGHTAEFSGIFWHQGETDSGSSTDTYLHQNLIPLIKAFRNSSLISQSSSEVPFVVGNLVPTWVQDPSTPWRRGVLVALSILHQFLPFTACTPSLGLIGDKSEAPNPIHFSAESQRHLGKRYFAAWKLALLNHNIM